MKKLFKKTVLFALVAALGLASLPFVSVAAQSSTPTPAPQGQLSNERLGRVWARQLRRYQRMGRANIFVDRIQMLIDRAKANGKDVSAVQAALDAFKAALKNAQPIYESTKGIVNSHQGFGDSGKVIDPVTAQQTVLAVHAKFQEIRTALNGTGKALRDAIRTFRQANPQPTPTSK